MLEIRNLIKVYPGPVAALRGVSLSIPHGMFGLLGPNGSGKTTLMRILTGLLEPTSGTVRFGEVDVVAHPEQLWPRLGHLPQAFGFYPNLSGEAMLVHMLRLKGVAAPGGVRRLAGELLARVNLSAAAARPVKSYSGGMRQRLGIAQAIAGDPDLLIVDEPTAGLDPEERVRFYRLLAELAERRTILLSTHIVEDVAMLCPNFAVIRNGRLLVRTTPATARAELAGTMYEGEVGRDALDGFSARYRVTQAHLVEGRNRVRVHLPAGEPPPGFVAAVPTLEDAYLLWTKQDAEEQEETARGIVSAG
ncbi:MAG: ATP-binding cassette domain-containing protein [Thermoanaerobaculia bacterium]